MSGETEVVQLNAVEELKEKAVSYLTKLGGRKFALSVMMFISTAGLNWFDKIDDSIFSVIAVAIISAYTAANVVQKKIT